VRRTLSGGYRLRLSAGERDVLRTLPQQLSELLDQDNPALRRLFPPAFEDDPKRNEEYHRLMREDLVERHRQALETMARTVDATELTAEELTAWLGSLNDFRLVLGTTLDVTEDDMGSDDPEHALYHYLSYLEESVVTALAGW
jgi:predicted AAA+ superfamily ATPase